MRDDDQETLDRLRELIGRPSKSLTERLTARIVDLVVMWRATRSPGGEISQHRWADGDADR